MAVHSQTAASLRSLAPRRLQLPSTVRCGTRLVQPNWTRCEACTTRRLRLDSTVLEGPLPLACTCEAPNSTLREIPDGAGATAPVCRLGPQCQTACLYLRLSVPAPVCLVVRYLGWVTALCAAVSVCCLQERQQPWRRRIPRRPIRGLDDPWWPGGCPQRQVRVWRAQESDM